MGEKRQLFEVESGFIMQSAFWLKDTTILNQAKRINAKLTKLASDDNLVTTELFLDKTIIYKEIAEMLTKSGYDVYIHRGRTIEDSWVIISWENTQISEEHPESETLHKIIMKPGEIKEI